MNNKERRASVDTLANLITGKAGFETTIKLTNGHAYTVKTNGKWHSIQPHARTWTQEEIADPSILELEYELVKEMANQEFQQRVNR